MTLSEATQAAERLLPGLAAPDGELDPRWQAIIKVAEFIESNPEEVWEFAARWGQHPDQDLQTAVGTCVLEHLLEYHFELMFERMSALAQSSRCFAQAFLRCWKLGQAERPESAARFDALQDLLMGKN